MGFARAWFPSRRSVDIQMGALVIVLEGHVRSCKFRGVYGLYLTEGSLLQMYQVSGRRHGRACACTYSIGMVGECVVLRVNGSRLFQLASWCSVWLSSARVMYIQNKNLTGEERVKSGKLIADNTDVIG